MTKEQINKAYNAISGCVYSTKETQQNSFDMGKYVVENNIDGDIIECGIAAGANFATMMLGAISVDKGSNRTFIGFDSFIGIQLGNKKDTSQPGIGAITHNTNVPDEELLVSSGITAHSKQSVIDNFNKWNLNHLNIKLIDGWIQNTLPTAIKDIKKISILRLDMDMYAPTLFALEYLFPLISKGGVIIIDDWALDGARLACEEYFEKHKIKFELLDVPNSTPKYFFKK